MQLHETSSKQGLWIISSEWVMISGEGRGCWVFSDVVFGTLSTRERETADISTADISKTQQLTPKRSRRMHSSTSKNLVF